MDSENRIRKIVLRGLAIHPQLPVLEEQKICLFYLYSLDRKQQKTQNHVEEKKLVSYFFFSLTLNS